MHRSPGSCRSWLGIGFVVLLLLGMNGLIVPMQVQAQVQTQASAQRPVISSSVKNDVSPPLRLIPPAARDTQQKVHPIRRLPPPTQSAPPITTPDARTQAPGSTPHAPTAGTNFDGIGAGIINYTVQSAPPDANAAVGPNHIVETVNSDLMIFNKSGTVLYGPVPLNTLWSGFGGGCQANNDGDPSALYDRQADRWFIAQFSVTTGPYLICIAVSTTNDPLGSYYLYSFAYTDFPDYPKFGIWPDGYYLTTILYTNGGTTLVGSSAAALDRNAMLQGHPATQQVFTTSSTYSGLLPATLDGTTPPPAGAPNYMMSLGAKNDTLAFWKLHADWITPANSTFTGPTNLSITPYSQACGTFTNNVCIPQLNTTQTLDSLGDRLMYRLAYRNFGDHEALVVNHSITVGSAVGLRWYEVRVSGGTPFLFQSGTYAPPDSTYRWMGSIAMDHAGNMALGYSASSATIHPGIRYTGRLVGDAAGTMQAEAVMLVGGGSQFGATTLDRWGDYSSMAVDPSDDCTFWYTQQYLSANGTFNWHTRIGSFKFAACVPAVPVAVTGVTANSGPTTGGTNVTITGANFPASVTVKFGTVTATGMTRVSATQITGTTPLHAFSGVVPVSVTDPTNSSTSGVLASAFTYVLALQSLTVTAPTGSMSGNTGTATAPEIFAGTALALQMTGIYTDGSTGAISGVTFTSSDATKASVDTNTGAVQGNIAGSVMISATAVGGAKATIGVVVVATSGVNARPGGTHPASDVLVPGAQPAPTRHPTPSPIVGNPTPVPQPTRH